MVTGVRNGRGLVATHAMPAGAVIVTLRGRILSANAVWDLWPSDPRRAANCIRFGPETYLDPGDGAGAFSNHSCRPNTAILKVNRRLLLVALKKIRRGEELTHDYSTLLGADDTWTMRCNCGEPRCRGRIGRFDRLPIQTLARYRRLGLIAPFIESTLDS